MISAALKYSLFIIVLALCTHAYTQVPVREEPRHKTVLLNDYIRLIDVHLNPHDTTLYHIHATPSVIVFISKSLIGTQDMSGTGLPSGEVLPGQTVFRDYAKDPVTHRVFNSGDSVFHVMDIELEKQSPSPDSCKALQQNNIETTINEKLVQVYRFNVNNGKPINVNKSNCAYLLICISGKIHAGQNIQTGEFAFFKPNSTINISNQQHDNSTCVLLQLK